jgi:outer membrane protein TolC
MTPENKKNWSLGLRMDLPLFKGFRTVNEEKAAAARVKKIRLESLLLQEGIALQVKDAFLQVGRAQAQVKATRAALDAAVENRDLNTRAYMEELVETKDVIEAQMIEFFIIGQYLKATYDHAVSQGELEYIIGKGIDAVRS